MFIMGDIYTLNCAPESYMELCGKTRHLLLMFVQRTQKDPLSSQINPCLSYLHHLTLSEKFTL